MEDILSISRQNFVQLVSNLGGYYPNPDDPGPYGPLGPVIRSSLTQLQQLSRFAGNPDPFPAKETTSLYLAQVMVDHVSQLYAFADLLPVEVAENVRQGGLKQLDDFGEWCGTMTRWEIIQELVRQLLKKHPSPPPHKPWWNKQLNAFEQIVIGAHLQQSALRIDNEQLSGTLDDVGGKLMENGLNLMG